MGDVVAARPLTKGQFPQPSIVVALDFHLWPPFSAVVVP